MDYNYKYSSYIKKEKRSHDHTAYRCSVLVDYILKIDVMNE